MANEKITAIVEEIKSLTILELNELVKAVEEEFGVSAAAPVAVAGAGVAAAAPAASGDAKDINAPLPGTVTKLVASAGAELAAGDVILVMEAMKMETEIKAEAACRIAEIAVTQGQVVSAGDVLARIEEI